jgi:hypothetical protein
MIIEMDRVSSPGPPLPARVSDDRLVDLVNNNMEGNSEGPVCPLVVVGRRMSLVTSVLASGRTGHHLKWPQAQ